MRQHADRLLRQSDVAGSVTPTNDERLDLGQRVTILAANLKCNLMQSKLGADVENKF